MEEKNIQDEIMQQQAHQEVPMAQAEELMQTVQNSDMGFEPVVAPKKPKEIKKADLDIVSVAPVEFVSFKDEKGHLSDDPKANLDIMQDVKMHITVE